ncbi:MAG: alpha-amylase/4-alpha-glucanotransferase domain-containing protein [Rhodocyclaceae bacterium]
MTQTTTLLLGVHAHQPVGNFPEVIDEAHERCYRPFLATMHRYPDFRFAAHFSGWLLDYLQQKFPQDMALLKEMVQRGQVEMFSSGHCEPVLAAIPSRDRIGQLRLAADKIEGGFGRPPVGAWLTERVWESTVVPSLADSGIRYVAVDDYHFLCTGKTGSELDGFYTTEEDGRKIDLFPISEALRYRLPFAPARETLGYLENLADQGQAAAIYFDDIEKFGIWPETYEWVYEQRWLEHFVEGVLRSGKITTATFHQFHQAHRTRGIVYLPTASYIEMNQWTLPAAAADEFDKLLGREKDAGRFERTKPFVRGGIWRNFFSRYPESNWMHKRMLQLSRRLEDVPVRHRQAPLYQSLYCAQANDAYWHGLFGGLYLPHLRRAIWNNLLELEESLDAITPRPPLTRADIDCDGREELFLHNAHLQVAVRLDGQAAPLEFDSYPLRHNFGDTLRRTREHYHGRLDHVADTPRTSSSGIASAHDRVQFKHTVVSADLVIDDRPRALMVDVLEQAGLPAKALDTFELAQANAPLHLLHFSAKIADLQVDKKISLDGARLVTQWVARFAGKGGARYATRINLAMPSCDGFAGRYRLEDGSIPGGFGQRMSANECSRLRLEDEVLGGALVLQASRPVRLAAAPYHTVSLSEAGFEKIMQGVCLDLSWELQETPADVTISIEVIPNR